MSELPLWILFAVAVVGLIFFADALDKVGKFKTEHRTPSMTRREAEQLRRDCDGWDDPEDRCPRNPDQCRCWIARRTLNPKGGDSDV